MRLNPEKILGSIEVCTYYIKIGGVNETNRHRFISRLKKIHGRQSNVRDISRKRNYYHVKR